MILGLVSVVGLSLLIRYTTVRAQDRFLFLKAGTYFLLMELTYRFALLLSVVIVYLLIVKGLHYQIDIFNFGIIAILIGAIFNFYIVKFLGLFHKDNSLLIMQVEYYIQWQRCS